MSGIAGILNTDGSPVSQDLLLRMTEFLRFRGPDAQNTWFSSEVGFGHALLDTSGKTPTERQPSSHDGTAWIVADARIDARAELVENLRSRGIEPGPAACDSQLILAAYQAWGRDCVQHLQGDFAFAIWDASSRLLFCARDHFGVKPFYYANLSGSFVFSNTLNCLRLHPGISSRLNDLAISDYLLFGGNQDPSTTSFAQVQRLAPAHSLVCSESSVVISRYWTLQQASELHYQNRQDYIENFRIILRAAVQDRLPAGPVGAFMSGGLDSSTVAAVARQMVGKDQPSRLQAYSVVYDRLIPDQERHFAGKVADFCAIPLHYLVADNFRLFEHWQGGDAGPEEPCDQPLRAIRVDLYNRASVHSRVVLTGEGGDPCLLPSPDSIQNLLGRGKLLSVAAGYLHCALWQRTLPKVGLRTLIRKRLDNKQPTCMPVWMNPEIVAKFDLQRRAAELAGQILLASHHRPESYASLSHGWWANNFEQYDPANTPRPVEARHPFFDLRLVNFLLNLPTLPWCIGKQLFREAMVGFLPQEVIRRRKTALGGNPVAELLKQPSSAWIDLFEPRPEFLHYVDRSLIPAMTGTRSIPADAWENLRPITLNHWLLTHATVGYKGRE